MEAAFQLWCKRFCKLISINKGERKEKRGGNFTPSTHPWTALTILQELDYPSKFHRIFRKRMLWEFLSQLSHDYAVGIFFSLISFTKSCACFPLWYLPEELQGAASFYAEVRHAADSTYSSPHSGNSALFDLRDIVCQHKKVFQSSC